jgi:hypothetical protein
VVFQLDKTGFSLVRGVAGLAVMLVVVVFAELFTGVSDPGGEYGYRMSHLAVFGVAGPLATESGPR